MSNWAGLVGGLVAMRKRWGLSAADVAELVGVHERTVYNWESLASTPTVGELLHWADALACDLKPELRK